MIWTNCLDYLCLAANYHFSIVFDLWPSSYYISFHVYILSWILIDFSQTTTSHKSYKLSKSSHLLNLSVSSELERTQRMIADICYCYLRTFVCCSRPCSWSQLFSWSWHQCKKFSFCHYWVSSSFVFIISFLILRKEVIIQIPS